jgi:uncharacterized protein (TIGR02466 family)
METLQILHQQIYKFKSTPYLLRDTQNKVADLTWSNNLNNLRSIDGHLHKNTDFIDLHEWFHECLLIVKREVNYWADDIKITQSWANKNLEGSSHHPHCHANSIISGVYYLTNSDEGTKFYIPSIWGTYNSKTSIKNAFEYFLPDNSSTVYHAERAEMGTLIIFPSNLDHFVDPNASNIPRYTISFNSFLCGDIGDFANLSGLRLEIK